MISRFMLDLQAASRYNARLDTFSASSTDTVVFNRVLGSIGASIISGGGRENLGTDEEAVTSFDMSESGLGESVGDDGNSDSAMSQSGGKGVSSSAFVETQITIPATSFMVSKETSV